MPKKAAAKKAKAKAKKPLAKKPRATAKAVVKKPLAKKTGAKKAATKKPLAKKAAAKKPLPKKKATVATKAAPKKQAAAKQPKATKIPQPTPSGRVLATCAELPAERVLTREERDAMAKVTETARRFVGATGSPATVVSHIASFVDEVRLGRREEPKSQDVRLGLGVLWGEQVRAEAGWEWVHLTYPDGFASYALVPADRAFACFPLNRVPDALRPAGTNTSAHVYESIEQNRLPVRRAKAYLVIG